MTPQTTPPQQFSWLYLRTKLRKEELVADRIRKMGFLVWRPMMTVAYRTIVRGRFRETKTEPILAQRLFAAVPVALAGDLMGIYGMKQIDSHPDSTYIQIPHHQIEAFQKSIDRLNKETLALAAIGRSNKKKAQWRHMKSALEEMIRKAGEQLEAAA